MRNSLLFSSVLLIRLLVFTKPAKQSQSKQFTIANESGSDLSIFWFNPDTEFFDPALPENKIFASGTKQMLDSYTGHRFEIRQMPSFETGTCAPFESCQSLRITVTRGNDQIFVITSDWEVDYSDALTREEDEKKSFDDFVKECRRGALRSSSSSIFDDSNKGNTEEENPFLTKVSHMSKCLKKAVHCALKKESSKLQYQIESRKKLSDLWGNYTCQDTSLETSSPKSTSTWTHNDKTYTVSVLHSNSHSQIHLVEDFITDAECQFIKDRASVVLSPAVSGSSSGESRIDDHFVANSATVNIPWQEENIEDNHVAKFTRRVFNYTNHALPSLNLSVLGQEGPMFVQFESGNKWEAHVDGSSSAKYAKHKKASRVSTMMLFCSGSKSGINFKELGLHVKPKKNNAIFLSYVNAEKMQMDDKFYTLYNVCPVVPSDNAKGEKESLDIVFQFMRVGVDLNTPANMYNTLDELISEAH